MAAGAQRPATPPGSRERVGLGRAAQGWGFLPFSLWVHSSGPASADTAGTRARAVAGPRK